MNNDVLTVRQFAKIAGVSYQSVYKRINHKESNIQPYVVNRVNPKGNTQTYLDKRILDDPELNPKRKPINQDDSQSVNRAAVSLSPDDSQSVNPVDQPVEEPETASGDALTAHLKEEVIFLRKEVERLTDSLQKEIERLTDSLQFEQKKNEELATKLHQLQAPAEDQPDPPAQPEPPKKSFRALWNNFWNISTPQK